MDNMYNQIDSNASIIRLPRGDSFEAPLFINDGDCLKPERHIVEPDEKVYFGVREPNKYWEQSILKQIYTDESEKTEDGDIIIKINPEETEYLIPGTYYYEVKLVKYENDKIKHVRTVVPLTLFYIL